MHQNALAAPAMQSTPTSFRKNPPDQLTDKAWQAASAVLLRAVLGHAWESGFGASAAGQAVMQTCGAQQQGLGHALEHACWHA